MKQLKEGSPCPKCTSKRKARGAEPWPLKRIEQGDGEYILKCLPCNFMVRCREGEKCR